VMQLKSSRNSIILLNKAYVCRYIHVNVDDLMRILKNAEHRCKIRQTEIFSFYPVLSSLRVLLTVI